LFKEENIWLGKDSMLNCRISVFGPQSGGRNGDFLSSTVRLGVKFPGTGDVQYGAEFARLDGLNVVVGEGQLCEVRMFNDEVLKQHGTKGAFFELFEGARKIGNGKIE
tara:strand:- start:137 stop:460 length:324 start_codon:yes stop_codon:yes gene_type:complete